jgi:hypothetical protein
MKSAIESLNNGQITTNEFAVLTVVRAGASSGRLNASTTQIADSLNGELSRHAVARALRSLQKRNWLSWNTGTGQRNSTIVVA